MHIHVRSPQAGVWEAQEGRLGEGASGEDMWPELLLDWLFDWQLLITKIKLLNEKNFK